MNFAQTQPVFAVAGDGPDLQYHERIFEIFQTLKPRDQVGGSGLGMTVDKKIIESHGGLLRLESTAGAGTTFYITWPRQEEAVNQYLAPRYPAYPARFSRSACAGGTPALARAFPLWFALSPTAVAVRTASRFRDHAPSSAR
jgi:hypothetical protein